MSAPFTPAARTRTRSSFWPGSGSGRSSTTSAPSLMVTARTGGNCTRTNEFVPTVHYGVHRTLRRGPSPRLAQDAVSEGTSADSSQCPAATLAGGQARSRGRRAAPRSGPPRRGRGRRARPAGSRVRDRHAGPPRAEAVGGAPAGAPPAGGRQPARLARRPPAVPPVVRRRRLLHPLLGRPRGAAAARRRL